MKRDFSNCVFIFQRLLGVRLRDLLEICKESILAVLKEEIEALFDPRRRTVHYGMTDRKSRNRIARVPFLA